MTKRLSGRERVAAAAEIAGWTLVADGAIGVDHYRLARDNVFVSHSVIGAVTWLSTSTSIVGVHTVGKAAWAVDYFRTHSAHASQLSAPPRTLPAIPSSLMNGHQ